MTSGRTPGSSASAWTTRGGGDPTLVAADGAAAVPEATELLVTADGGGSNASRSRLWKGELQKLADDLGLTVRVCHVPPGTSKWNAIGHRLSAPSRSTGGPAADQPGIDRAADRRDGGGDRVGGEGRRGSRQLPLGLKASDAELAAVRRVPDAFRGEWNDRIEPRSKLQRLFPDRP